MQDESTCCLQLDIIKPNWVCHPERNVGDGLQTVPLWFVGSNTGRPCQVSLYGGGLSPSASRIKDAGLNPIRFAQGQVLRNPALYLYRDLMYSVQREISQEGEGESASGLWSESSNVERIPSPICSQRSDGIWSVRARIHKVDPNIAPDRHL